MADTQKVEYEMSLKDLLTGKIKGANDAINAMEGSLHSAAGAAAKMGLAIAGIAGIAFGFELFKSSLHEFMEADKVMAQLRAGIESTGGAAGVTFDELKLKAEELSKVIPYTGEAIMDVQSQLLTFPKITKSIFGEATEAIFDMSARTHRGANELAIMLGKALQDPEKGITAMRRVGVNFSKEQTELVKHLVETGKAAEAQKMILDELKTEYGGSALAAGQTFAGQMEIMNEEIRQMKEELGGVVAELVIALKPAMEWAIQAFGKFVHIIKDSINWMREHSDLLKAIAIGVSLTAIGFGIYTVAINAASIATAIYAGWLKLVVFLMDINPMMLLVTAIAAVISAIVYCYLHFAKFRAVLWGLWGFIKEFGKIVADVFMGLGEVIIGVLTFSPSKIIEGGKRAIDAVAETGQRLGAAFKTGYDEGMADFAKDTKSDNAPKVIAKQGPKGPAGNTPPTTTNTAPKATAAKNITINISQLVGSITNNMSTVKESMKSVGNQVMSALLGAVNDSQIIAGE